MIKRFLYIPLLIFFAIGCTQEDDLLSSGTELGNPVTLSFDVTSDIAVGNNLKATEGTSEYDIKPQIRSLEVWVFDSKGIFVDCAAANLKSSHDRDYNFDVVLHSIKSSCRVHLVANFSILDRFDTEFKGRTESSVFSSLRLDSNNLHYPYIPMWNYLDLTGGIDASTEFTSADDPSIKLFSSVSFVVLKTVEKFYPKFNGTFEPISYALYNRCSEGLIAAYDVNSVSGSKLQFDHSGLCQVPNSIDRGIPKESDFVPIDQPLVAFDQNNNDAQFTDYPYVILKCKVNGNIKYAKIDIVELIIDIDNENVSYERFDIRRGRKEVVEISGLKDLNLLPNTIEDAVRALPHNNVSLAPQLMSNPVVDYVDMRLKLENVKYVTAPLEARTVKLDDGSTREYNVKISAQYFSIKSQDVNDELSDEAISNLDQNNKMIKCMVFDKDPNRLIENCFVKVNKDTHKADIYVKFSPNIPTNISDEMKNGKILVYVQGYPELMRLVNFTCVPKLDLKAEINPGLYNICIDLPNPDYTPPSEGPWGDPPKKRYMDMRSFFSVELTLPKEYTEDALPIDFIIFTDKLFPSYNYMLYEMYQNDYMGSKISYRFRLYSFRDEDITTNPDGSHTLIKRFETSQYLDLEKYEKGEYKLQIQTIPYRVFSNFGPATFHYKAPDPNDDKSYCLEAKFKFRKPSNL